MKEVSVFFGTSLKGADENGELRKNPMAFRNINAAISLVVEAAMTGCMPEPLVNVVGGLEHISLQLGNMFLVAGRVNRVRCQLFSGAFGHICLAARIDFIGPDGQSVLRIEAGADSQGIRFIREAPGERFSLLELADESMKQITWEEVLRDPTFAKGEIEIQENPDKIYRGPIKGILTKGDGVYFRLLWCAHYDLGTDKWTVAEHETGVILCRAITTVTLAPDGHLILQNPEIIVGNVFPEGGSRLDPAEVAGLDLNNLPGPQVVKMD